ncbi:NAD-dependent malic enzyme domain protein, partial [Shigella dysenteriae]|nr:NAD-dependent malic enzyme domain protein [Shigella dysenteriae]
QRSSNVLKIIIGYLNIDHTVGEQFKRRYVT